MTGTDPAIDVFNIDASQLINLDVNFPVGSTVVVNVSGASASWNVPEPQVDTPPFLALIGRLRLEQVFGMKGDCNKAKLYQAEIGKMNGPGLDTQCARTIIASASLERVASKCAAQ